MRPGLRQRKENEVQPDPKQQPLVQIKQQHLFTFAVPMVSNVSFWQLKLDVSTQDDCQEMESIDEDHVCHGPQKDKDRKRPPGRVCSALSSAEPCMIVCAC